LKALFFDPHLSDDELRVYERLYVENLSDIPKWALRKAFTRIAGDTSRRALPKPGEVRAEAMRITEPLRAVTKARENEALPAPTVQPIDLDQKARIDAMVKSFAASARSA
jgi:hypothetical protein